MFLWKVFIQPPQAALKLVGYPIILSTFFIVASSSSVTVNECKNCEGIIIVSIIIHVNK